MTTRREFAHSSLTAILLTWMAATPARAQLREMDPFPFDDRQYELLVISLMATTGLPVGTDGSDQLMDALLFDRPLPAEYEWARGRCRWALRTMLDRLEAA